VSTNHPVPPQADADKGEPKSPNFQFLASHHSLLVHYAAQAERYLFDDPSTALFKLRQFVELLAQQACANAGIATTLVDDLVKVLGLLRDHGVASSDTLDLFHSIRKAGNAAAHEGTGTRSDALHHLRMARQLAVWFDRSFGNSKQLYGPFVPPPNPAAATTALVTELDRLRQEAVNQQAEIEKHKLTATEEAEARKKAAADAERAYSELNAALELAEESESRLEAERKAFEQQLVAAQKPSVEVEAAFERIRNASALVEMDEAATHRRIDQQLRDAGWEADTETLRHALGVRPQKNKNMAIAEWPTAEGPADYVLFIGLSPVAAIEAKKVNQDVAGKVEQGKRYSRGFEVDATMLTPGGPWKKHALPFCFSTNGRPYLRQLETRSGIWFCDVRKPTNLARALEGWYTPTGLEAELKKDVVAAQAKLEAEPTDYLPLRDYQMTAVRAVEDAIAAGRRAMLVAMATGTGKTVTCLGMIYRLLKSGRFRRVLFLVDRTSLENQAFEKFEAIKLEGLRAITEIYDVKCLGDLKPESDTRLHFGTVQGMVKRVLYATTRPMCRPWTLPIASSSTNATAATPSTASCRIPN
jgi:type I restriction enzyme R subunit